MSYRSYYVVKVDGTWGVKLERGRYIQREFPSFKKAKRRAVRLALKNNRGLAINDSEGGTRRNLSPQDVERDYRDRRWTPAR